MRKFVIILLSVCFLVSTVGCKKEPADPTTVPLQTQYAPSQPTEATEEIQPPIIEDLPLLAFSAPVRTLQHYAEDGTLLFTYAYQDFSLILEDPQVADAIVIDLLNYVDYENSAAKNVLLDAQEAYDPQNDWSAFTYSTFFTPQRFDQGILSLYGVHSLYTGSPRSASAVTSITYDLLSGRPLSLKEILIEDYSADTLSQLITDFLSSFSQQGLLFSDYAYVISELFTTNRPIDSWYLSDNGLCFYFAPYEIAPYSSGTIVAEIPYSSLVGLLKDAYFPLEVTEHDGLAYIDLFQSVDLEQFDSFAELIINENSVKHVLYTGGCIQNVRVELGSNLADGTFLPEATIFASPSLCIGDGIVMEFSTDILQNLRLLYEANGETIVSKLPLVYS